MRLNTRSGAFDIAAEELAGDRERSAAGHRGSVHDALEFQDVRIRPGPPLSTRAVIEAEREVLAACLTAPAVRAELLGWLTPEDFSRSERAATWAAFGALTDAGTPVDYVTLAWECERHNPDHDSPGLPPDQLVTMAAYTPGMPGHAVHTVAHAFLLRHTDAAHHQIQTITEDPAGESKQVTSWPSSLVATSLSRA